jgi:hypothetical protein
MRIWITLLIALCGTATALAGELSFDVDEDGGEAATPSDRTVVVKSVDELALNGISGAGAREVGRVVERVFKDNPEATRVRVSCGTATEGSTRYTFVYPRAVTPLDAEARPHGAEWLLTQISINFGDQSNYRLVPWSHGVRDGLAREFKNGKLAAEVPWRNGELHGARRAFFPDGTLQGETHYVDGLAEGPARLWDEGGNLLSECDMKGGARHGVMTEYWPGTDKPQRVVHYKDNRVEGVVREFYRNGKLKRERHFRNDAAHGVDRIFDEEGNVAHQRYWLDGDPVSREEFDKRGQEESGLP